MKLEYIKDGVTIGTSISYVGFVGILTAVRKDLSISLNFRPSRDRFDNGSRFGNVSSTLSNVRYYLHLLMVLVGFKPALPSLLRSTFFSKPKMTLTERAKQLAMTCSAVAYFTLSDGNNTIVLEKELNTAKVTKSNNFLSVTNHDVCLETASATQDVRFREFIKDSVQDT